MFDAKWFLLTLCLSVLATACQVSAELIGHWPLDEAKGAMAHDESGNENDGALVGDVTWVSPGRLGAAALSFDGENSRVEVAYDDTLDLAETNASAVTAWIRPTGNLLPQRIILSGGNWDLRIESSHFGMELVASWQSRPVIFGDSILQADGDWVHLAAIFQADGPERLYVNGQLDKEKEVAVELDKGHEDPVRIGAASDENVMAFAGLIDDVRIYNHALERRELAGIMTGSSGVLTAAHLPQPEDGAMVDAPSVILRWEKGAFATSHDLYIGTSFADVDSGAAGTVARKVQTEYKFIGIPGAPMSEGLQAGTTYYWRIDEVSDTHPESPWKGQVWSFCLPPKEACDPEPSDGVEYVMTDAQLSWQPGLGAAMHSVKFGRNKADVTDAGIGPVGGGALQSATTFDPPEMAPGTAYYWRVDTFDREAWNKGEVWSFTSLPEIAVSDATLRGWWTLDEGVGGTVVDWSGHGHHGTLLNGPKWATPGIRSDAVLNFEAGGWTALQMKYDNAGNQAVAVCAWIRTDSASRQSIISFDRDEYWALGINDLGQVEWNLRTSSGNVACYGVTAVGDGLWHHVCGVFDKGTLTVYVDGQPEASASGGQMFWSGETRFGFLGAASQADMFNGKRAGNRAVIGDMADVRVYSRALAETEIKQVMRGDVRLAWDGRPTNGAVLNLSQPVVLRWKSGDGATQHDVYVGTDPDSVFAADRLDLSGVYRGRQVETTYTPTPALVYGRQYFWRIDEVAAAGTIVKGMQWSFTLLDHSVVDDFEKYGNASPNRVFQTWIDGLGFSPDDYFPDGRVGNGTGAMGGHDIWTLTSPHYNGSIMETTDVHGGNQSMPFYYDNTGIGGKPVYSEIHRTWEDPQDWAGGGAQVLTIWLKGAGDNAPDPLYVVINGIVVPNGDPSVAATAADWTRWEIDLSTVAGLNPGAVTTLAIGVGNRQMPRAGGTGMLLLDDIQVRLAE